MQCALDEKLEKALKTKAAFVAKQQARAENGEAVTVKQQTVDMMQAALDDVAQTAKDDLDPETYWDLMCEAKQEAEGKVEAKQEGDGVEGGP